MYTRLQHFHAINNHCQVPSDYDDDSNGGNLNQWVRAQRKLVDRAEDGDPKYLERKRKLDLLDFEYDSPDAIKWLAIYQSLQKYAEKHGNCQVPYTYDDGQSSRALGAWCHEQRNTIPAGLKKTKTSADYEERKRLLDSLGFEWTVETESDKRWKSFFARMKAFKEQEGHCFVSPDYENGEESSLYAWSKNQVKKLLQRAEKGDPVAIQRKKMLDSIGFEWKSIHDNTWEQMYASLVAYKAKYGHCRVPYRGKGAVDGPSGSLGIWVYSQRTKIPKAVTAGDIVCVERKQRLDDIGFEWLDVHSGKWETMYAGLERFHKEHGHCRVKRDYKDKELPANLGAWMSTQRKQTAEKAEQGDEVAMDRKQRLDALGFVWQTRAPRNAYERQGKTCGTIEHNPISAATGLASKKRRCPSGGAAEVRSKDGAPGPDDIFVEFSKCDGLEEPTMWKKPFAQHRRYHRREAKQSLVGAERTKEIVNKTLQDRWLQLAGADKSVYRAWTVWDQKSYGRDLAIFKQQRRGPKQKKRKSSS